MSETTEILFNSPALHSLRRDQLQKLCKIHSIKANGKNTELIDRLKQHAFTLPKDDPLSIAARSERDGSYSDSSSNGREEDGVSEGEVEKTQMQRPSEQWEVMESIQEVEETASSQGALSSLRTPGTAHSFEEFGTTNSKTSSVTSSIKALANSLGLKQAVKLNELSVPSVPSKASGEMFSIPYSATRPATPPLNDNFTFDPTTAPQTRMSYDANGEPLPGCALRPGEPAPENARLSMGLGLGAVQSTTPKKEEPTTTIRLVSTKGSSSDDALKPDSRMEIFHTPKLKPFATNFDLVMSPSAQDTTTAGGSKTFWAPDTRPRQFKSIYPILTIDDLPPDVPPSPFKIGGDKLDINAVMNTGKDTLEVPTLTTTTSRNASTNMDSRATPEPFVFGSPRHSVTNTEFRAAATSILEEMNKRLLGSGVEGVGMDIIGKLQPGAHTEAQLRDMKPLPRASVGGVKPRGSGEITKKFDEMHQADFDKMEGIDGVVKRRMEKKEVPPLVIGKKRKSNVLGELGDRNGKPRRPTTGPASVGHDFGNVGGGRTGGSTRVISNGRRGKALPGAFGEDEEETEEPIQEVTEEVGGGEEPAEPEEGGRGKRARIDPEPDTDATSTSATNGKAKENSGKDEDAMNLDIEDQEAQEQEQLEEQRRESRRQEREREAIKRKLEMSRAKRRSSVGGAVAAATKSATVAASRRNSRAPPATPNPKPSRFGFLTSAKKLVASVWNRGKTPASKPTTIAAAATGASAPTKSSLLKRKGPTAGFVPNRAAGTSNTSAAPSTSTATPMPSDPTGSKLSAPQLQDQKNPSSSNTARSRSPIPPTFNKPLSTGASTSNIKTSSIRASSTGSTKSSRVSAVPSSGASSLGTKRSTTSNTNTGNGAGSMGLKPKSQLRASSSGSSRLLAPTASSLAKMKNSTALSPRTGTTATTKKSLLGSITNSPKVGGGMPRRGGATVFSPTPLQGTRKASGSVLSPRTNATPVKIFSKPVMTKKPSGIPVMVKSAQKKGGGKGAEGDENDGGDEDVVMDDAETETENGVGLSETSKTPGGTTVTRQRMLTRKPRISRSKVIAKLASQRLAASSSLSSPFRPKQKMKTESVDLTQHRLPATPSHKPVSGVQGVHVSGCGLRGKRTRSSIGVGSSSGVGGGSAGGRMDKERNVLVSAKKRVRQSEYARRRSRMSVASSGLSGGDECV